MAYGLQIFDAAGNLIVDTNTRIGTFLDIVSISNADGSATNAALAMGTPFWLLHVLDTAYNSIAPSVSVSGTTISWAWRTPGDSGNPNCKLIYGVF